MNKKDFNDIISVLQTRQQVMPHAPYWMILGYSSLDRCLKAIGKKCIGYNEKLKES